ncbi:adenine phosphoribosyltransferase [Paramicrobacterium chengjingii]|uniref:Adenine phosphoribosyltransferase n=1 Tax=Paramicrobacterium chengjingii TaxID=2769067 RepID=A0ABX6YFD9_9MICO|nr:adenine phosphoribosyltransferase [Microbacterium chengjingii]QPZ37171.1 adenine phosphoribosyltransferase [Microbacterium chengjingii]
MNVSTRVLELSETIPDFPKPGIVFRDLTPAFADPETFRAIVDELGADVTGGFDVVAGIEARGFLLASAIAYATRTRLFPIRKQGKLPGDVLSEDYALEYGAASLEVNPSNLPQGSRVLIVDDVLATGGSCRAAARLVERSGSTVAGIGIVLALDGLGGVDALRDYDVSVLLTEPTQPIA